MKIQGNTENHDNRRNYSELPWKIIIASIATPAELGKLNTFVALLESLIPLAFVPLFDQLWKLSLLSFPGLNFLITAAILGFIFLLLLVICVLPLTDK